MATRLVGRADELSALLAHCASEPPGAVLLTGEAGVGKTRLLDELAERLSGTGTAVLRGSAVPGGGPFRPLARALVRAAPPDLARAPGLRPYAAVLARLLPGWPLPPPAAAFDAEVLLREALTRWEPAGEVRLLRWCRERLRMLGLPVPRPSRDHTTVPPGLRARGVTGRELEVLRLVAEGASNLDVADRLHLCPRTVETHVSNLLAKTGATARAELAV